MTSYKQKNVVFTYSVPRSIVIAKFVISIALRSAILRLPIRT